MKHRFLITIASLFLPIAAAFFIAPSITQAEELEAPTASNLTGEQMLITVPTENAQAAEQRLEGATDAFVVDSIATDSKTTLVVRAPENTSVESIQQQLAPTTQTTVQTDAIRRALTIPNDSFYTQQWHHGGAAASINSASGWDVNTGSANIVIAVVDTGIDLNHPDLNDNLWINIKEIANNGVDDDQNGYVDDVNGYDFTTTSADSNPSPNGVDEDRDGLVDGGVNHGTHVAGIIAAEGNNGVGVSGVMWDAQLMAVQVLDDEGAGFDSDIAEGIRYAADNGADIINLSLGGHGSTTVLQDAVTYAHEKGALLIAAAGNDGVDITVNPFYPACYTDVIGVASVGASGAASSFSNFGSNCVDVSAPGEFMLSTFYEDATNVGFTSAYGLESGTSMATPVVSGVAGLLASIHPTANRTQLQQLVIAASRTQSGLSDQYGIGIIDASKISQQILLSNIKGFDSSKKKITLKTGTIYGVQKPYFEWTTAASDIAKYYVYFGTNPNANPVSEGVQQTSKKFTPTTKATGDEKNYYLRVQAETASGVRSNILTYTYVVDTVVPAPKKPIVKQVSKTPAVKVAWKKVSNQHVAHYEVLRKKKGSSARTIVKKTTKTNYTDTAVTKGTTYEYSVKAKDDLGNTKESKKVTVKVK